MVTYHKATTDIELQQILNLQALNLKEQVDHKKQLSDGFVTLQHDFDLLKRMNSACPHIIAKEDDEVVGFALSMLVDFRVDIPLLEGMFAMAEKVVSKKNYLVMGQICVAENYRGKGVFRGLYNYMKISYNSHFDPLITLVAKLNIRSLNAHKAIGFKEVHNDADVDWVFIVWEWNQ